MASKDFLFVNKHSNSPSLSRNTGAEASLASKVNKHVQQRRFYKDLGTRTNWYRPFVRSECVTASPDSRTVTPSRDEVEDQDGKREGHALQCLPSTSSNTSLSPRNSVCSSNTPRSVSQEVTIKKEDSNQDYHFCSEPSPTCVLASRPGDSNDPFNTTVIPLTPKVMEVIQRHLTWTVSSSVTDFAIRQGYRRVFSTILQNQMHTAAFLAFVTVQLDKLGDVKMPYNHSPELYSYKATRLIRQHIETHSVAMDPYVLLDVFRLALGEWIRRNHRAAKIHFSFIAQNWHKYSPQGAEGQHNEEVFSSEDVLLAIDLDEKPLLALTWEPSLVVEPNEVSENQSSTGSPMQNRAEGAPLELSMKDENGDKLIALLNLVHPRFGQIAQDLFTGLKHFPNFSSVDFAAATVGPVWTMKRRIQATLHRLQSLDVEEPCIAACIRRTLLILLILATTSPARRVGRTDMARVARRLQSSLKTFAMSSGSPTTDQDRSLTYHRSRDSGLWLWMCATGLVAANEEPSQTNLIYWFSRRTQQTALQHFGSRLTTASLEGALSRYLFFQQVYKSTIELCYPAADR